MHSRTNQPVLYTPAVETVSEDEVAVIAQLRETMLEMSATMHGHTGHAMRSVHAKSFGLLRGTLEVLPGLPPALAQGLFSSPHTYDLVVRFSSPPAEQLDDRVSLPRAVALKVLGVQGERLPGSEGNTTRDFLMVDGPVFVAKDAKDFMRQAKLLATSTDKAESGKRMLSVLLRGANAALNAVGVDSTAVQAMGGHRQVHPLGATFFTQVPLRYGQHIAKLSLVPVSSTLTPLIDAPLGDELANHPDGLREAVVQFFAANAAEWELRAQLNTDLETMPIEDACVQWSEEESPYLPVARLAIASQSAWHGQRSPFTEDRLSFSPWHGLAAHRPLGGVMRARREIYSSSVAFRGNANGCPIHEPEELREMDARAEA
jgi:hypothetical protein